MEKLSRDLKEAKKASEDAEKKLHDALEKVRALNEEKCTANASAKRLEAENAEMKAKLQQLQQDLAHKEEMAAQKIKIVEESLRAANEKCIAAETKLNAKDSNFEMMIETMQKTQIFSQEQIATLSADKRALEEKLASIGAENTESGKEILTLKNEKDNLTKELDVMTKNHEEASAKVEELTAANGALASNLASEQASLKEAQADVEKAKIENTGLHIELGKLKSTYEEEKEAWTESKGKISAQTEALEAAVKELTEKNDTLESENKAIKETTGVESSDQLKRLQEVSKEAEMLRRRLSSKGATAQEVTDLRERLSDTEAKLAASDARRRKLHNKLQELRGNVRVLARIRPAFKAEEDAEIDGFAMESGIEGTSVSIALPPSTGTNASKNEMLQHDFSFNRVFDNTSTQMDVFAEVSDFVQSSLDGFHVSIFSYGQTGSGKTYTMTGDSSSAQGRGIIPRAVHQVLEAAHEARAKGWEYTIKTSYLEIYNETIRDLLADPGSDTKLEVRASATNLEERVSGLIIHPVERADEIDEVLDVALQNRSVAATDSNAHSSRSHSVFTLLSGKNKARGVTMSGSLNMCDLAGSERLDKSKAKGDRLKETQAINKSLSSSLTYLARFTKRAPTYPFRNSKLTHLLQPSLSGQGKALMLVNLSSDASDAGESLCSLRFAKQVNQTELGVAKRAIQQSARSLRVNTQTAVDEEEGSVSRIPGPARGRRPTRSISTTRTTQRTLAKPSARRTKRGKSSPPAGSANSSGKFGR